MSAQARRDVFQAIADPTRRDILGMIANGPMNLNAISDKFDISRPAISNHIKILTQCGMVVISKKGRERYCQAKMETLAEVSTWIDQYKKFWNQQFDSLDNYILQTQHKNDKK